MATIAEIEEGLSEETLRQLRVLEIASGRPLIAVDVDEVLVRFVPHLDRFMRTFGFEMRLVRYELEGSMFRIGSDEPLPFEQCLEIINDFFHAETERQEAVPDGADVLSGLADAAQVIVLTNVPRHATRGRRRNLDALGLTHPMVVNSGGKGRAMAWLAAQADAPVAFVDDSVRQIESVAKYLPEALRLHFAEAEFIRRIFPTCEHATAQVHSWRAAERELRSWLGTSG